MPLPDPGPDPHTNSDAWVIEAEGLSKRFEIYLNDRSRFFEFFGRRRHHEEHWALRDLSFKVRRGRSFGVIGANGAGKSTLLKLIAGISEPTRGRLEVKAPLSTLLDLAWAFIRTSPAARTSSSTAPCWAWIGTRSRRGSRRSSASQSLASSSITR
ncbi:MAG: ATP-binding cassette domain-containing protein [Deltaproteobacteria bacterium]|nr:ATP-binding cassette domain-containing protein [Deltaproteobacteria bacterium]